MKITFNIASIAFFVALAFPPTRSAAQSNPLDKKLEQAHAYINDKKLDDADSFMQKVLEENPGFGDGWDLLGDIRFKLYEDAQSSGNLMASLTGKLSITTQDSSGKEIPGGDSLARELEKILNSISPAKRAYSKTMYTLRKATYLTREAYRASTYLRAYNVDLNVDSNVSKKAIGYFNEAEEEFGNKNYTKAATLYKRACEEQPGFYKAQMYLGDCYYATGNSTDAIVSFKAAKERYPFLLEPRKYLVDAYAKTNLYDKALAEAISAVTVYPDYTLLQKLEDAAYMDNKRINIQWTARGTFPNKIEDSTKPGDINAYSSAGDTVAAGPWAAYKAALGKLQPFCNKKGIVVKPTTLTSSKYLEVYSWEEMLRNSNDPSLSEARRIQKLGYLDCYVMVSCFHYDFYEQYLDFVTKNRDRVVAYFNAFTKSR